MRNASKVMLAVAMAISLAPAAPAVAKKSDRGSLAVIADGVPVGRSAKITVAGKKKFRKKLPAAGKLRKLRKGTYRVWAAPIVANGGTAAVPNLPVKVKVRKRQKTTLRLSYSWNPRSDSYPPSPATDLEVTSRSLTSVSLAWTNGVAPDLRGVVVRRKTGSRPALSLDDGRVVPVARAARDLTDNGLRPNATYTYSVFMEDTAGNISSPATVTVRTKLEADALAAGTSHTCALLSGEESRAVVCWGRNDRGQLGDGSDSRSSAPRTVDMPPASKIAAGAAHTCAIDVYQNLWCWGANEDGQLGDGGSEDSWSPQWVALPGPVVDVAAGGAHTCAVLADQTVTCWGANSRGQVGIDPSEAVRAPVVVAGLDRAIGVAAGHAHTCAIRADEGAMPGEPGGLWCWGANGRGQLGDGSEQDASRPVNLGLSQVSSVSAGVQHTCAVADERVLCWGGNDFGQVGDGTRRDRDHPVFTGLRNATSVAAGAYHSCALSEAPARCWGRNNSGRLGDGTTVDRTEPEPVSGWRQGSQLAAGAYHTCMSADGVLCWGANGWGQLGTGDTVTSLRPLPAG